MGKATKSPYGADKPEAKVKEPSALTQILNGEFLTKSFVLNNLPYIFFIILLLIAFVAKGYYVKQLKSEIKINETELNQNAAEISFLSCLHYLFQLCAAHVYCGVHDSFHSVNRS